MFVNKKKYTMKCGLIMVIVEIKPYTRSMQIDYCNKIITETYPCVSFDELSDVNFWYILWCSLKIKDEKN